MNPAGRGEAHRWPALDGLRSVAIACVVAYHLGHLAGGWIGVDIFFVLSGYLITNLLLTERAQRGRIGLRGFWSRRARRLLPAVLLLLLGVGIYAWAGGPGIVPAQLRGPGLATLFYGANWQQIAASHSYFSAYSAPNPLVHMWSLAIEEQYYVVWPLVVAGLGALAVRFRRRDADAEPRVPALLLVVSLLLCGASAIWMGACAHLDSINRAYLGTDTRAWELLLGGVGAMVVPPGRRGRGRGWRWAPVAAGAGLAAAIVLAGTGNVTTQPPWWVWNGGLVAAAACALVVLVGSVQDAEGPVARLLSLGALVWLGRVSYSLYLWHVPVIDFLTPATTGMSGVPLLVVRLGAMTATTCASYYLVERPLRRADWSSWSRRALVPIGIGATAAVVVAATVSPVIAGTAALGPSPKTATNLPGSPAILTPSGFGLTAAERPSAANPLRVWILGDSVMNDSSPGVTAALEATGDATVVADSSIGGWGLTTTNWQQQIGQILEQYHPDIVMGTWSWDDTMAADQPANYRALLHRWLATLLAPGDGVQAVVLFEFPQIGPDPNLQDPAVAQARWTVETRSQDDWDRIARQAVGDFHGRAAYVATAQLFAPHGRYLAWMRSATGAWVRARKLDNAHMCPYGAAAFGQLVVSALQAPLGLDPLRPGWASGAWTTDPRYDDPTGACPNDQPPVHYRGLAVPTAAAGSARSRSKG